MPFTFEIKDKFGEMKIFGEFSAEELQQVFEQTQSHYKENGGRLLVDAREMTKAPTLDQVLEVSEHVGEYSEKFALVFNPKFEALAKFSIEQSKHNPGRNLLFVDYNKAVAWLSI